MTNINITVQTVMFPVLGEGKFTGPRICTWFAIVMMAFKGFFLPISVPAEQSSSGPQLKGETEAAAV